MKLPFNLPFLKNKPEEEFFLALVLRDEKISALIFKQKFEKVSIVSRHEENLSESLEKTPLDDLVSILDKIISHAETKLPADTEIKNTVFGVKDSWVTEKKISKDYLARLKHVCSELDLTPIGFIVLSEAIAHLIQQEEAAPVTALLTEVGEFMVTVSLFRAGKLIETVNKSILDTPMQTVDEALKEFENVEILPSRLILFQSSLISEKSSGDLSQKFIAHQWSKTLPFLQIPQISILPHGFDGKAIVSGAAVQLGYTLASLPEDSKHPEIKTIETKHSRKSNKGDLNNQVVQKKRDNESENENFGFVLDKDITTIPGPQNINTQDFNPESHTEESNNTKDNFSAVHESDFSAAHDIKINDNLPMNTNRNKKLSLNTITVLFSRIRNSFHSLHLSKKRLVFIPPIILIALIGLVLLYFFQLKATVILYVSPKSVNETERITLSTALGNDFTQNIIAAKDITVILEGSSTTEATGEKEVGEKAKGTVTLYNSDTEKKTFKEGSILTSEKGLKYITDKDVSVASASGDIFTGIKSGTAQITITADKIGTEYNLPSNSKFSIEDTDSVAAKNDAALSGGSKKKVTVVTEKDVDKLKQELPKSLEEKAKTELRKKLSTSEELLTGFTDIKLSKEELDPEINSETRTVKLAGSVSFTSIAYNKEDLLKFAQESLKAKYTKENLSDKNIDTKLSGIKDKSETELTGVAAINAGLLPIIEIAEIKSELKGKSFTEAIEYTKSLSNQINNVEIKLRPNLPFLPNIMPRNSENINIVIQTS